MAAFVGNCYLVSPSSRLNPTNFRQPLIPSSPCYCHYPKNDSKSTNLTAATGCSLSLLPQQRHQGFGIGIEKQKRNDPFLQTFAVRQLTGSLTSAEGLRFAIVVARFNEIVTKPLLEGALDTFKKYSVKEEDIDVVWVPGSFEIGVVAEKLGKSRKYQAILCIGAV